MVKKLEKFGIGLVVKSEENDLSLNHFKVGKCLFAQNSSDLKHNYPLKALNPGHETIAFYEFTEDAEKFLSVSGCRLSIMIDMKKEDPLLVEIADANDHIDNLMLSEPKDNQSMELQNRRNKRAAGTSTTIISPIKVSGMGSTVNITLMENNSALCCDYARYRFDIDASDKTEDNPFNLNIYPHSQNVALITTRLY